MKKIKFIFAICLMLTLTINAQTVIQNGFAVNTQLKNLVAPYISSAISSNTLFITNDYNFEVNTPYTTIPSQVYTAYNNKSAELYSEFKQGFSYSNPNQYDSISINFSVKNIKGLGESSTRYYVMEAYINGTNMKKKAYINSETSMDNVYNYAFKFKTSNNLTDTIIIRYVPSTQNNPSSYQKGKVEISNVVTTGYTSAVGVSEYSKNNANLSVFPNPSNGDVNIKFNASKEKSKIEVFDIQGRLVLENDEDREIGLNKTKLNLEDLSSGIYIVRVENKTFKITLVK